MKRLFSFTQTARSAGRRNRQQQSSRTARFEQFEPRRVMSVNPALLGPVNIGPLEVAPENPPVRLAEGTISLNTTNGVLTVDGSDRFSDKINIYINHRSGHGAGELPSLLTVSLDNAGGQAQVRAFELGVVSRIVVNGYAGNDFVDNRTAIPMNAFGGIGSDVILGGLGDDFIAGGDGHDFIDGRSGHDMIFGEAGNDKLFGDNGFDSLYGGADNDFLFGGYDDDSLYGEDGNDVLFGGWGNNRLIDKSGSNQMYANWGDIPSRLPTIKSFRQFYVFDHKYKDPTVRSLVRLSYRDMTISREEMISVLQTAAADGVESVLPHSGSISTYEFADFKWVLSTSVPLQMRTDVRYLATAIVKGNTANANYQGEALGNLKAGVAGDHLHKLVDKWFKGGDLPVATDTRLTTLRYEHVQGSLFVNGASYDDIDQSPSLNNCYFLAALGEVAQHSPGRIAGMFHDNGDGTFSVRFYQSGKPVYVTVNRMLPVFRNGAGEPWAAGWGSYYSTDFDQIVPRNADDPANELWVALAEKAYVQLNEMGGIGQNGQNEYAGIDFGLTSNAFKHITNRSASNHSIGSKQDDTLKALNAGKAITFSSKADGVMSTVVASHAYQLVGYDANTKRFELYNPHGPDANESRPMVIYVTWSEIRSSFHRWTSVSL